MRGRPFLFITISHPPPPIMQPLTRRQFVITAGTALTAASVFPVTSAESPKRKMTIDLMCGAIGVKGDQKQAIEYAAKYGFESVGPDAGYLAGLSAEHLNELKRLMAQKNIRFGAAGLPVEFRQSDEKFKQSMVGLPKAADGLQRAGVTRICTWLTPSSGEMPYVKNFKQHAHRLREAASVLKDRGIRLGLEYVGPKTAWASKRFPFIHSLPEMTELIGEIGTGNVGYLLDSWHWWNAGDTVEDVLALSPEQVVAVDLNDAPAGIPKDQQVDSRREIPCATGVINVGDFLTALNKIGYEGPVRAEPFNKALNDMADDEACRIVAASLRKAMGLISS